MSYRLSGVYAIVHQPSGRVYVGSSCDIFRRWKAHVGLLNTGLHHAAALSDLWLLDGPAAFSFTILEQCPKELLQDHEQEWLDRFAVPLNTSRNAHCPMFDTTIAAKQAATMKGRKFSAEHRANLSKAHKGLSSSLKGRKFPGRTILSPESRAKISATLRGHPVSEETRAKMRAAKVNLSDIARMNMSAAHKGNKCPAVSQANRRRRGMPISEKRRQHLGRLHELRRRRVHVV